MSERLQELVKTFFTITGSVREGNVPGLAIGRIDADGTTEFHAEGTANLAFQIPISERTPFHVASVAKQITAAIVLQLVQQGRLSLDASVAAYLPKGTIPQQDSILVRHLVQHTSGLRDQWVLSSLWGWRTGDRLSTADVLWMFRKQTKLNAEPGAAFNYCNTGYTLLAMIVEGVVGKSFGDAAEEMIFRPLGMSRSRFRIDHTDYRREDALAYVHGPTGLRLSIPPYDIVGATSLVTTVEDLCIWAKHLLARSGSAVGAGQLTKSGLDESMDYGFGLYHFAASALWFHGGWDYGFSSFVLLSPAKGTAVVACGNLGVPNLDLLAFRALMNSGALSMPLVNRLGISWNDEKRILDEIDGFVGVYANEDGTVRYRIARRDGELFLAVGPGYALRPLSKGCFALSTTLDLIEFTGDLLLHKRVSSTLQFKRVALVKDFRPSDYEGEYRGEEVDVLYSVIVRDGDAVLERNRGVVGVLEALGHDRFEVEGMVVHFKRGAEGAVRAFAINHPRASGLDFVRIMEEQ